MGEKIARNAPENPFSHPGVPVSARHDQVATFLERSIYDGVGAGARQRRARQVPTGNTVAREVRADILRARRACFFVNGKHRHGFGALEKWQGIEHGAPRFPRVLPGYDDTPGEYLPAVMRDDKHGAAQS